MRVVGPSSEEEMVLAFLQAEVYSPRFREFARAALGDMSLVYNPRLDDAVQNTRRRQALQDYRGFGRNEALFRGFPEHAATWERMSLTREDLGGLRYANAPEWVLLSRGSRLVSDGAKHVGQGAVPSSAEIVAIATAVGWPAKELDTPTWRNKVREASDSIATVQRDLGTGRTYAPVIIFAESRDAQHIVAEGHTRATAYFLHLGTEGSDALEAIVGYAPLGAWIYR
ncbi:MAG: hypothetical protein M3P18_08415 [Actinomycetota bacterium]|nr:hypothetical protein [Actinomycetota bacterium]